MKGYIFVHLLTFLGMSLSLFYPFVGIIIYILFGVMHPHALWYYSIPPTLFGSQFGYSEVIAYPTIVGWMMNHCGNWDFGKGLLPLGLIFLYVVWITISLAATHWTPAGEVIILMNIRLLLAMLIVITLCNTTRQMKWVLWALIFGSGFVAYELNISYWQGFDRLQLLGYAGMDNNFFAVTMVVGASLAFFEGMNQKNPVLKAIAFFLALLQIHVVLFSMSRGGMLGLCVVGFVTFLLLPKTMENLFMFFIIAVLGLQLAGPSVRERFMTSFADEAERDASAQGRVDAWLRCLKVMQDKPLVGVGVKNWTTYSRTHFGVYLEAHSTWMQTGADSGIPALVLQLGFFLVILKRLLPYARGSIEVADPQLKIYAQMVIVALSGYCVTAQFVSLYTMEITYYTATLGLIIIKLEHMYQIKKKEEQIFQEI
ncbi:MAG: O-antigen ligase family protein [Planctomycetia bacterium]|nr:O-antigen ligase family protein [Planctomycetia bacterium]